MRGLPGSLQLGQPVLIRPRGAALWPAPHQPHFDFEATADGAEWIDELARQARDRLAMIQGPQVIGHFDWRVGNLGFHNKALVAIYDLDSLALAPEVVLVGCAAAAFSSNWEQPGGSLPNVDEMRQFVDDYELARSESFSREEREVLDAANLAQLAYGARCQWSNHVLFPDPNLPPSESWLGVLRDRAVRPLFD